MLRPVPVNRLSGGLGKLLQSGLIDAGFSPVSTLKVLLVEDDPTMRTTLQRALSRRGMQVDGCDDGGRALAAWRAGSPDVVVLDLTLPGLDGLQVLEQARR